MKKIDVLAHFGHAPASVLVGHIHSTSEFFSGGWGVGGVMTFVVDCKQERCSWVDDVPGNIGGGWVGGDVRC